MELTCRVIYTILFVKPFYNNKLVFSADVFWRSFTILHIIYVSNKIKPLSFPYSNSNVIYLEW